MTFCAFMPSTYTSRRRQKRRNSWQVWWTKVSYLPSQKVNSKGSHRVSRTWKVIARIILGREPSLVQRTAIRLSIITQLFKPPKTAPGSCKRRGGRVRMDESLRSIPFHENELCLLCWHFFVRCAVDPSRHVGRSRLGERRRTFVCSR